jgi:tetratricopeptide (TPR) repeat protein
MTSRFMWLGLIPVGCVLTVLAVRCQKARVPAVPGPPAAQEYSRLEPPEVVAYYQPDAPFMETIPLDLERFLGRVAELGQLPRRAEFYPTDPDSIHRAAVALVTAARDTYGFTLSLEAPDATQLDRFCNDKLVDEPLRRFLQGDGLRANLSRKDLRAYEAASQAVQIPDEPLLYYALGSFWGEWLVVHGGFAWRLYPPLRPRQSFPDMAFVELAVCVHPFSQVTKKLADPEGDRLVAALAPDTLKQQFPPYLLTASLGDAEHAVREATPRAFRRAQQAEKEGRGGEAVSLYEKALATAPPSARLYTLAVPAAWEAERWDLVEAWLVRALALQPRHPILSHKLALLYSKMPGSLERAIPLLETAIAEDPTFARARLTLASCLQELGRSDEARKHAQWVAANDPALKAEAVALLRPRAARR